jgi:hypothetical protein
MLAKPLLTELMDSRLSSTACVVTATTTAAATAASRKFACYVCAYP